MSAWHSQDEQLAGRQAEIERLQLLIAKLRRMKFGRRSEKLERQIEQPELANWTNLATASAEPPAASPTPEDGSRGWLPLAGSRPDGSLPGHSAARETGRFCPRKRPVQTAAAR